MRHLTALTLILPLAALAAASQPSTSQMPLDLPHDVLLVAEDQMPSGMYHAPYFYPVGWSPEGSFAYVTCREVAGRGGTYTRYVIQNAVTDQLGFEESVDIADASHHCPGDDRGPAVNGERSETWRDAHREAQTRFAQALENRGIERRPGTPQLHRFPLTADGTTYRAELSTTPASPENQKFWDRLGTYRVDVTAEGRGSKRIAARDDVEGLSMWVIGAFRSPFEPRILVVIGHEVMGFEGTEARYLLSGAHLQVGYE